MSFMGGDKMITAVIMASGFSHRYGRNKLLLEYKGKYLIEHTLDLIHQCPFFYPILVTQYEEVAKLGKEREIEVIFNPNASYGQSESIKLGVKHSPNTEGFAFFTGDQPLLDIKTLEHLVNMFFENPNLIIVPRFGKRNGTPVIFPYKYKEEFLSLMGDTGGKSIIQSHLDLVKFVSVRDESVLFDIDTLDDYEKLLSRG